MQGVQFTTKAAYFAICYIKRDTLYTILFLNSLLLLLLSYSRPFRLYLTFFKQFNGSTIIKNKDYFDKLKRQQYAVVTIIQGMKYVIPRQIRYLLITRFCRIIFKLRKIKSWILSTTNIPFCPKRNYRKHKKQKPVLFINHFSKYFCLY